MNVNGGVIVLGYLLGVIGVMLIVCLFNEMGRCFDSCYGMVMMCIGVGMGVVVIFEYVC